MTPLIRSEVVDRSGPPLVAVIDAVSARLTTERLRELNGQAATTPAEIVAHRWLDENEMGRPNFTRFRDQAANEPMEKVGQDLRALMNKQGLKTTTG